MGIAIGILIASFVACFYLSSTRFKDKKFIVWGVFTMFSFAPLVSWLLSISYGVYEGSGFAAMALMMVTFPIFLIVGVVILVMGLYRLKYS